MKDLLHKENYSHKIHTLLLTTNAYLQENLVPPPSLFFQKIFKLLPTTPKNLMGGMGYTTTKYTLRKLNIYQN